MAPCFVQFWMPGFNWQLLACQLGSFQCNGQFLTSKVKKFREIVKDTNDPFLNFNHHTSFALFYSFAINYLKGSRALAYLYISRISVSYTRQIYESFCFFFLLGMGSLWWKQLILKSVLWNDKVLCSVQIFVHKHLVYSVFFFVSGTMFWDQMITIESAFLRPTAVLGMTIATCRAKQTRYRRRRSLQLALSLIVTGIDTIWGSK